MYQTVPSNNLAGAFWYAAKARNFPETLRYSGIDLFIYLSRNISRHISVDTYIHTDIHTYGTRIRRGLGLSLPSPTIMILSFRTDRSGQTVQTQIRLLLEEQSDQGLHCLPFRLHLLDSLLYGRAT